MGNDLIICYHLQYGWNVGSSVSK